MDKDSLQEVRCCAVSWRNLYHASITISLAFGDIVMAVKALSYQWCAREILAASHLVYVLLFPLHFPPSSASSELWLVS